MAWDKELKEAKAYALWHFKNVADEDFALMSNLELINWYRGLRKVA